MRGACVTNDAETIEKNRAPIARSRRWHLRLGIGGRLALGLAAVATVLFIGHDFAQHATAEAVATVRSMQVEHAPLARRAGFVIQKLVAYDRAVIDYVRADRTAAPESVDAAGKSLLEALAAF